MVPSWLQARHAYSINVVRMQDSDIVTTEVVYDLSNIAQFLMIERSSRSFIYCKLFHVRFFCSRSYVAVDNISTDVERRAVPLR